MVGVDEDLLWCSWEEVGFLRCARGHHLLRGGTRTHELEVVGRCFGVAIAALDPPPRLGGDSVRVLLGDGAARAAGVAAGVRLKSVDEVGENGALLLIGLGDGSDGSHVRLHLSLRLIRHVIFHRRALFDPEQDLKVRSYVVKWKER